MSTPMSTTEAEVPARILSERTKYRLRLVAKLFKSYRRSFNESSGTFYDDVLAAIEALEETDRQKLRELVDWIEAFDRFYDSAVR